MRNKTRHFGFLSTVFSSPRKIREVVADQFAATAGEDGQSNDQTCPVLLAPVGRESFDQAAVRGDGTEDCGAAPASGVGGGVERSRIWRRKEVGTERCVRKVQKTRQLLVWLRPERLRSALSGVLVQSETRIGPAGPHWLYTVGRRNPKWKY